MNNIKNLNLAQINNRDGEKDTGSEDGAEPTIADLTSQGKDEISSNSTAQTEVKKEDGAKDASANQDKKEEKKEEQPPKKEEEKKEAESTNSEEQDGEKKQQEEDPAKKEETPKANSLASSDQSSNSSSKDNTTQTAAQSEEDSINNAQKDVKVINNNAPPKAKGEPQEEMITDGTNAILITGATHARELLSSQVPLYVCLKLLHQGYLQNNEKYQRMLASSKFYFIPIINVDGAALVEQHWETEHQILNKRKNANPEFMGQCGAENAGTDLNRNYGIDWEPENAKNRTELCGDYWPGSEPFSEPESRGMRDFVGKHKNEIKFIINCHTSGNDFIWPYNGREPNDIEKRSPGYL